MLANKVISIIALLIVASCATAPAAAHDSWIARGALKNGAGEWCCGLGDCGVIDNVFVKETPNGYEINGFITYYTGEADDKGHREPIQEIVPYSETQPSPDGAYWRCKRPDGTRRCFFSPPGKS